MTTTSVAQRLHDQLWRVIAETKPGERLPSEPFLAQQLGVSRATLREAMRAFETQGLIRRRQGSGTYVNYPPQVIQSGLEVLESIETLAQRSGLAVAFGALNVEHRAASAEEAQTFSLPADTPVVSVSRSILADQRTVAYLVDILPQGLISDEELNEGFRGSILDLLLRRGEPQLSASNTQISAVPATSTVARVLGIQRGDVLLCFTADLYSASGRIVDHSLSYFLPGHFSFHVVRRVGQA